MNENALGVVTTAQAWGFFQVFLRVVALFSTAPVFGSRDVPVQVRIALALLLSLALYPLASRWVSPAPPDLFGLAAAALRETLIGLLMGLVVTLLFQAALVAGDLIDLQMGFGMAAVFNPSLGTQTAMMGQFLYRYTLVVFLLLNGHHLLLEGVLASFEALPAARFAIREDTLRLFGDLAMTVLSVGLRIAAPAVATLLLVDVALALVSRAVPQMNVFVVGMPVKIIVGMVIFVAALGLTTGVLQNYVAGATGEMLNALRTMRSQ
jgi:flagellar biosynthetic protein FliR